MKVLNIIAFVLATATAYTCPDGWQGGSIGECYKFLFDKVGISWIDAQYECEVIGGFLAEPKTEAQNAYLLDDALLIYQLSGIQSWHLGLTDLGDEGNWYWQHSHSPVDETYWGESFPNPESINTDDCAVLHINDTEQFWMDIKCDEQRKDSAPLCQYGIVATTTTTTQPPTTTTTEQMTTTSQKCPDGYLPVSDGLCIFAYIADDRMFTWFEAENYCNQQGGHLVSIGSPFVDYMVQQLVKQINGDEEHSYWLGGLCTAKHECLWSDGSDFTYSHFNGDAIGDEACTYQNWYEYGEGWATFPCSRQLFGFVCQVSAIL